MIKEELKGTGHGYNIKLVYISPTPILSINDLYRIIIGELKKKYGISVNYNDAKQGFEEILRSKLSQDDILVILLDQLEQGVREDEVSNWPEIAKKAAYNIDEILRVVNKVRGYGVALAVAVYPIFSHSS